MKAWMTRLALLVVAAVFAVGLVACGDDDDGGDTGGGGDTSSSSAAPAGKPGEGKSLTLGSKNFTEQFVLGELYKQALEAKGYTVNYKKNLGSSEIADKSLTSGQIDAYPEYVGIFLSTTAGDETTFKSVEEAYAAAKKFAEGRGDTLTTLTPFSDTDAIATTKDYATKNNLKAVGDLKNAGDFTVAGPPEFKTRFTGLVGLKKVYGLDPTFKPLAIGLQYKALDDGQVDAANVFTTDGQLQGGKYTVLEDPENLFGFQNVMMVTSGKKADELGPEYTATIDAVSAKLTARVASAKP